jgi:hypothetical protein
MYVLTLAMRNGCAYMHTIRIHTQPKLIPGTESMGYYEVELFRHQDFQGQ